LETGDSGKDASHLYRDPDLLGHLYVGPYLELQPDLAFVLADDTGPAGYVLGALDSREFEGRAEREWWPALRQAHPAPDPVRRAEWTLDEWRVHLFHHPWSSPATLVKEYPSHLHIDLLPHVQGNGHGRRLIETLFDALREHDSPGVHLGVGRRNPRAIGFYRHIGFTEIQSDKYALWLGLRL
jgi:ribosomal protein S18 acetylase RimI-like enzyme